MIRSRRNFYSAIIALVMILGLIALETNLYLLEKKSNFSEMELTDIVAVLALNFGLLVAAFGGFRYLYLRLKGVSDKELNPELCDTETIELVGDSVVFGGDCKYPSIKLSDLVSIRYLPTEDDYQDIRFEFKEKGAFYYSLNNSEDYLRKQVEVISNSLSQRY